MNWIETLIFQNFYKIKTIKYENLIASIFRFISQICFEKYSEDIKEYIKDNLYFSDETIYFGSVIAMKAGYQWKQLGTELLNYHLSADNACFRVKVGSLCVFNTFLCECSEESQFRKIFEICAEILESTEYCTLSMLLIKLLIMINRISIDELKSCEDLLMEIVGSDSTDDFAYNLAEELLIFIDKIGE
ncbi:hypothetical protein TVAG_075550 [Trichomonas vaginalis G3]|uniref:Uncharacterized protein n=1 Tax=Trichomonas vaginalis (strain ATCC PRA-98 / G3) TaxID=412133 RepID=A2D9F2_TRIV3|nr:hypothetical protein TVAGG3_0286940 [Trichomonas vaginalis G3]EAY22808.1 hypothetical protein TVAG_075550 [Trichomonas vaginalis G3]KAI5526966.1 hypothetical protein TVAGG3_0286940 [Trichomonas vaginalis G3]|eukprot:XP_001583794.1 hypothetical protein [Trichomonas vaginalis G3]